MGHIVRNEEWGTVDLDPTRKHVFVREEWEYIWKVDSGQAEWTSTEQAAFHRFVDRSVWLKWSNKALIRATPDPFASRSGSDQLRWSLAGAALTLSFDVKQVRADGHWRVTVSKVDPLIKKKPQPEVDFANKRVRLYSTDMLVKRAYRFIGDVAHHGFNVHAHEFGHTLANVDEYRRTDADFADVRSIMNVGRQLRARHLSLVCDTLTQMVPRCAFVPLVSSQR